MDKEEYVNQIKKRLPQDDLSSKTREYMKNLTENEYKGKLRMDYAVEAYQPTITDRRIEVSTILGCLRDDMTIEEIMEDYELTKEQVLSCIDFAISILKSPFELDISDLVDSEDEH